MGSNESLGPFAASFPQQRSWSICGHREEQSQQAQTISDVLLGV